MRSIRLFGLGLAAAVAVHSSPSRAQPVNVLVNAPSGDGTMEGFTQSETTMVVFGNTVLVAFNDSGSLSVGNQKHFTGYARSTDGGATFTDLGALPDTTFGEFGDPTLARDATSGTIYLATLGCQFIQGICVFRSTDGGVTFRDPVQGVPGGLGDRELITVDNFPGLGQGRVYLAAFDFSPVAGAIRLYYSSDGGQSFGPNSGITIAAQCPDVACIQGAWVTVGPDHSVFVFWWDTRAGAPRIMMRKSTDLGQTFGSAVVVATQNTFGTNGDLGLGGFRSDAFPRAAVNPVTGHLYVVYNDDPGGLPTPDRADVLFTMSTDAGTTWTVPARVNSDSTTNDQWQPTIAVTPDGTRLGVLWYDRRLDPSNALIDYFGRLATIAGGAVTFQPDFRISDRSFPPVFGREQMVVPDYMGDYDQAQADACNFYAAWGDNRLSTAPDVRFAKIALCDQCPLGQGYWKTHADRWPVNVLTLGTQTYSQSELLALLNAPATRNASLILAQQLIAAMLNTTNGSDPAPVGDAISRANTLLGTFSGKLPYASTPSSPAGQAMIAVGRPLAQYNSGSLTPSCLR